jgi:hypothetical protein
MIISIQLIHLLFLPGLPTFGFYLSPIVFNAASLNPEFINNNKDCY